MKALGAFILAYCVTFAFLPKGVNGKDAGSAAIVSIVPAVGVALLFL